MTKRIIFLICVSLCFFLFYCEEKIEDTPDSVVIKEDAIKLYDSPGSGNSTASLKAFSLVTCLNPNTPTVKRNADGDETNWYKIKSGSGTGWTVGENILFRESPEQNVVMVRESRAIQEDCSFDGKVVARAYLYEELTYLGFKYTEQRDKEYQMALVKNADGDIGWSYEGGFAFDTKLGIAKQTINIYKGTSAFRQNVTDLTYERMDYVIVSMETLPKENWLKVFIPDPANYTKHEYYIEYTSSATDMLTFKLKDKEIISLLKPIYLGVKDDLEAVLAAYDSVDYLEALGRIKGIENMKALFIDKEEEMKRFIGRYENESIFYNEFNDFLQDLTQAINILDTNNIGTDNSGDSDADVIDAAVYESDGT